ncbi:MAG: hypothetical protein EHM83_08855, partial [Burkholderiales bacterium]
MSAASHRIDAQPGAPDAAPPATAPSVALYQRLIDLIPGRSRPRAGDYRLTRRNVFMLPTRAGLLFAAVVITMLVTAINYQLSLGYALTFLVASFALVGMLHTFRNLSTLTLRAGRAEPVFAGQLAEFTLIARNETSLERFALSLNVAGMAQPEYFDIAPGAEHFVAIALPTRQRGWMPAPRLTLATTYPIGVWRAWARWHPALRVLVYPQPETPAAPLPARVATSGEGTARGQGHEDIAALRPYKGYGALRMTENSGNSKYHSLQVSAERRYQNGLKVSVAYTLGKATDNASDKRNVIWNTYDDSNYWGPSNYDRRHVLVVSYIYDLPFWRDQNTLLANLLGGWQVAGSTFIRSGNPFSITRTNDIAGVGEGSNGQPVDIVGDPDTNTTRQFSTGSDDNFFFNPAAFANPKAGTFGNSTRNIL